MATVFKDYDGNVINVPAHDHVMEDTQLNTVTAYASTVSQGFIRKEEVSKIDNLKTEIDAVEVKMKEMLYIGS